MLDRLLQLLAALVLGMSLPVHTSAIEINGIEYDVYVGDVNGDNLQDVYLTVPDTFVLIHGVISIPLFVDSPYDSYLISSLATSVPFYLDPIVDESVDTEGMLKVNDLVSLSHLNDDEIADLVFTQNHGLVGSFVVDGNITNTNSRKIISSDYPTPSVGESATDPVNIALEGDTYNGIVHGQHSVGVDGSFNYTLPLRVPQGVKGVQPKLALTYNSSAKNGALGMGWSIASLSSISRCPASMVRDGYVSGVRFQDDFRFCLNGNRLVKVSENEYRTEEESFAKIIATGGNAKAPSSWIVLYKDGTKSILGNSAESKINDVQGHPMIWYKTREENEIGQGIEYIYEQESDGVNQRIKTIKYTTDFRNSLYTPFHKVEFSYENRGDNLTRYMAGRKIATNERLASIEMFSFGLPVWNYDLNYFAFDAVTNADPLNRSKLQNISFTASGSTATPIEFEWTSSHADTLKFSARTDEIGVNAFFAEYNGGGEFSQYPEGYLTVGEVDLDGDLILDYIVKVTEGLEMEESTPERLYVNYSSTGNTELIYTKPAGDNVLPYPQFIDVNGDSLLDIIFTPFYGTKFWAQDLSFAESDTFYRLLLNQGTSFSTPYNVIQQADLRWTSLFSSHTGSSFNLTKNYRFTHADFNGDGFVDVMRRTVRGAHDFGTLEHLSPVSGNIALNDGIGNLGQFQNWPGLSDLAYNFIFAHQIRDINGDSLPDVVKEDGSVLINTGSPDTGFIQDSSYTADYAYQNTWDNVFMGDVNGDGLPDQIRIRDEKSLSDRGVRSDSIAVASQPLPPSNSDSSTSTDQWGIIRVSASAAIYENRLIHNSDKYKQSLADKEDSLSVYVRINNGSSFNTEQLWNSYSYNRYPWCESGWYSANMPAGLLTVHAYENDYSRVMPLDSTVRDVNGDGMMDLVFIDTNEACDSISTGLDDTLKLHVLVSDGTGFREVDMPFGSGTEPVNVLSSDPQQQPKRPPFFPHYDADANNDGVSDIAYSKNPSGIRYAYSNVKKPYLTRVFNQHGRSLTVDYEALSNRRKNADGEYEGIYTINDWSKNTASLSLDNATYTGIANSNDQLVVGNYVTDLAPDAYSISEFQQISNDGLRGRYAVAEVNIASPLGSDQKTSYHYWNAKFHGTGYGSLGFQKMETTFDKGDLGEVRTVQQFNQVASSNWNLAGKVLSERVYATRPNSGGTQLISDRKFGWAHYKYLDDFDSPFNSPHYFALVTDEEAKTYSLETGALVSTHRKRMYEDNVTSSCPNFIDRGAEYEISNLATYVFPTSGVPKDITESHCDFYGVTGIHTSNENVVDKIGVVSGQEYQVLGLIEKPVESSWHYEKDSQITDIKTRTTEYSHDAFGRIQLEKIEPSGGGDLKYDRSYVYDNYGLVSSITETYHDFENDGIDFNRRITTIANEIVDDPTTSNPASQVWRVTTTNPLDQTTVELIEPLHRNQIRFEDINGLVFESEYDSFGRKTRETYPGGETLYNYRQCYGAPCADTAPSLPVAWRWYVQQKSVGTTATRTYFDYLDRERSTQSFGFNGDETIAGIYYDIFNNVTSAFSPRRSGEVTQTTSTDYDVLDRPIRTTMPNGGVETIVYNGLNATHTNSLNKVTQRLFDGVNREKRVIDHDGTVVKYRHDGHGNVVRIEVAPVGGNPQVHQIEYDLRGRKTALIDPDVGQIDYTYNALGLLATQKNSENEEVYYEYDILGRQTGRWDDVTKPNPNERYQTWTYDNKANGLGMIGTISGTDSEGTSHKIEFTYNSDSLLEDKVHNIGEIPYKVTNHYDQFHRNKGLTYPTGFTIEYGYNEFGHLNVVEDASSGEELWRATADNSFGNITEFSFSNGVVTSKVFDPETGLIESIDAARQNVNVLSHSYIFDNEGNLRQRSDQVHSITQNFCYDNLHRLTSATTSGGCSDVTNGDYQNADFSYDGHGNILKKDGITDYTYGVGAAGPHAVSHANGSDYFYDDAGRMISGGGRTISYTSFGKPSQMTHGSYQTNIVYGVEQDRIKRSDNENGEITSTVYVDKLYEKVETDAGVRHRHYIGDWGIRVIDESVSDEFDIYLNRDHIGSIAAKTYSDVTSASGIDWLANEPWGRRQDENWGGTVYNSLQGEALEQMTFGTSRGFTDHEHLDGVGLIHMNGRVYDPIIGRFVSPDPWIQDPTNSQSFNRYSYVWNNPLRYTDPSGEFIPLVIGVVKVVSWGMTAYGVYETGKAAKETIEEYQSGELSAGDAALDVTEEVATNLALKKAKMLTQIIPDKVVESVEEKTDKLVENLKSKVDSVSNTQKVDTDKPQSDRPCKHSCFKAGTLVLTDTGYLSIEQLKIGDLVWARDPATGETALKPIINTFVNPDDVIWELTFEDYAGRQYVHEVTDSHPYYDVEHGWLTVAELGLGSEIETRDKNNVTLVLKVNTGVVVETYTLDVAGIDTYFVSRAEVLVHNCEGGDDEVTSVHKAQDGNVTDIGGTTGGPEVGGGADLKNLSPGEQQRIQNAADRSGANISVVGSQTTGTKPYSDFDYVLEGSTSRKRSKIKNALPSGPPGTGDGSGRDFHKGPVDTDEPHITFKPKPKS